MTSLHERLHQADPQIFDSTRGARDDPDNPAVPHLSAHLSQLRGSSGS
jgi:hypothetical protein